MESDWKFDKLKFFIQVKVLWQLIQYDNDKEKLKFYVL